MDASVADLAALLSPIPAAEFFARYWEKSPLVVARREPGRYAGLLGLADLDFVLAAAFQSQESGVELLGAGKSAGGKGADQVAQIYEAYGQGATVRVNRAQRYWKPLSDVCRRLEHEFGAPVRANLYCSPAGAHFSERHYDNHDVLVLQLAGRKHWRVFDPVVSLPLADVPPLAFEERTGLLKYARGGPRKGRADIGVDECGEPRLDFTLEAGDLLYMPRGFVHEAGAQGEASLHVTIGLHVLTWLDLLSVALARAGHRDERFRTALPVRLADGAQADAREHFATLLRAFADGADFDGALGEVAASFVRNMQATTDGALMGDAARALDEDTSLEQRPGLVCRYVAEGGMAGLLSAQATLWMPESFGPALSFVAQTRAFRVRDLPGGMSDGGKLSLARRLVQDGFLRIVETSRAETSGAAELVS
ncbi:MAG: cupin domain-containing protein [Pyrinomonadaceae bacterium]